MLQLVRASGHSHAVSSRRRSRIAEYTAAASTAPAPEDRANQKQRQRHELVGAIALNSVPDGAEVYVDGNFVGQTPATLKLAAGKHTIRVSLKSYKDWHRDLAVLQSSEVKLIATLEKQD
jgi:hypothetical protein